ncbi:cytochrome P450 [Streptomyces varsoviensis]|uniref:cytochrome P450 n=1 Tax=Streptomyces varsoviensis TaxID=67373 RepID=UPI0033C67DE5
MRDTELALTVLRDPEFHGGMSSFFGDMLPSRAAQIDVGRAVRNVMRAHLPAYRRRLAAAAAGLGTVSQWPAAGPTLVYRCTAEALLHPAAPSPLRRRLAQAVSAGLTARQPHMWQRARVEMVRPKLLAGITDHVRSRRAEGPVRGEPRDVLDAVLRAGPRGLSDRAVTDLYVLLFQSIVGNVGYAVAWSLLLACLRHPAGPPWPWPADWLVREAGRHRPFVWMVGRPAPRPLEFRGMSFPAGAILSVSPYLLHHDPRRWDRPELFRPERWGGAPGERGGRSGRRERGEQSGRGERGEHGEQGPYLPFGTGPFICAGAAVAHSMTTEAVSALAQDAHLSVSGGDDRPVVAGAVLPRPFTLRRALKPSSRTVAETVGEGR